MTIEEIEKAMGWNHRILAHEHNGEIYLQIHEVYFVVISEMIRCWLAPSSARLRAYS